MKLGGMEIEDHGTVVRFLPETPEARAWLTEQCVTEPWQWMGGGLVIEHSYAQAIVDAWEQENA